MLFHVHIRSCKIESKQLSHYILFQEFLELKLPLHGLVNNAGIMLAHKEITKVDPFCKIASVSIESICLYYICALRMSHAAMPGWS